MDIHVIDNFYPKNLICELDEKSNFFPWVFTRTDSNLDTYWTVDIYGQNYYMDKEDKQFKINDIKLLWDYFSSTFKVNISNLNSCYINGLTFGIESHEHIDFDKEGSTTVIFYMCNDWNSHWGGETVFFDNKFIGNPSDDSFYSNEIIKSVLPKNNRIVMFDGNITHAVRPVSRSFKGLRKTLMFKLKDISINDLMGNYKCN